MALEKLIKNSIDTDSSYTSLYNTAVSLFDKGLDAISHEETEANGEMLRQAYRIVARQLQDALWCEWSLWLEAHGCDLTAFHQALVNVLTYGVNRLWEARTDEEFAKYVEVQRAA